MSYEIKGKTVEITATSRCAIKVKDNYYTIELSEKRAMPIEGDIDLDKEYEAIFDSVNAEVDRQCQDIIDNIKK